MISPTLTRSHSLPNITNQVKAGENQSPGESALDKAVFPDFVIRAIDVASLLRIKNLETRPWNYADNLDGVTVAPCSHEVLLNNDKVRVLRVTVEAGKKEPVHTHKYPSIMIVDTPAQIKYYGENDQLVFQKPPVVKEQPIEIQWQPAERPHSVENIDIKPYMAYRIEIKPHS